MIFRHLTKKLYLYILDSDNYIIKFILLIFYMFLIKIQVYLNSFLHNFDVSIHYIFPFLL